MRAKAHYWEIENKLWFGDISRLILRIDGKIPSTSFLSEKTPESALDYRWPKEYKNFFMKTPTLIMILPQYLFQYNSVIDFKSKNIKLQYFSPVFNTLVIWQLLQLFVFFKKSPEFFTLKNKVGTTQTPPEGAWGISHEKYWRYWMYLV